MNLIDLVIALAQEYPTRSVARVLFTNHIEALVGCRTSVYARFFVVRKGGPHCKVLTKDAQLKQFVCVLI